MVGILGIDPEKTMIWKYAGSPVLILALFTKAKTWKHPPMSTDRWMEEEDMVPIYNRIQLSHKERQNEVMSSAATDGPRDYHTLGSQEEKDKYHTISLICGVWTMTQRNFSTEEKQTQRHREQTCVCQGGPRGRGGERRIGISRFKLSYVGWIHNRAPPYSTGNCIQYLWHHTGKEHMCVCIYI